MRFGLNWRSFGARYAADWRVKQKREGSNVIRVLLFLLATTAAQAQEQYSFWAPIECCWTNRCCWKIQPHEVVSLGNDLWRIKATGQVVNRRGFSPDGEFHRCACDLIAGQWTVHDKAHTRCLFVPHEGT